MSTIDVANLSDAESTLTNSANSSDKLNDTTTVDTKFVTNGCAKAWVYGGTTAVINNSFNISSSTNNSAGSYSYALANGFTDANYIQTANVYTNASLDRIATIASPLRTSSSMQVLCSNANVNVISAENHFTVAHGELA